MRHGIPRMAESRSVLYNDHMKTITTDSRSDKVVESPFLTVRDVARLLGKSEPRIYQLVTARRVPAVKMGGRVMIPRAAFERWVELQNELALASVSGGP